MSTRANIVISKIGHKPVFLYHHHDGYPNGVGLDLTVYMSVIDKSTAADDILSTPTTLANWLCDNERHDEYEFTDTLHGDIEYLYIIDMDREEIICLDAYHWDDHCSVEEACACKLPVVYRSSMLDTWEDITFTHDYDG